MYDKQFQIRQETLDAAREYRNKTGCKQNEALKHVLVLDRVHDPYFLGGESDLICGEYAAAQWKRYSDETGEKNVHIRGLHYYLQALKTVEGPRITTRSRQRNWLFYEHTKSCWSYLQRGVKIARYLDLIPFDGIKDEKNAVTEITNYSYHTTGSDRRNIELKPPVRFPSKYDLCLPFIDIRFNSIEDYISNTAEEVANDIINYQMVFNKELVKPYHIELWCEKSLPDYVKRISGIDTIVEGSGGLSATIAYNLISRLNENKQDGIVLYLTDFDLVGNTMPVEMARKLQFAKRKGDLKQHLYLEPIAITKELVKKLQIEGCNLPQAGYVFNKDTGKNHTSGDTRKESFIKNKAEYFIELQALEAYPDVYTDIVRTSVEKWRTDDKNIEERIFDTKRQLKTTIKTIFLNNLKTKQTQFARWFNETVSLAEEVEQIMPDSEEIENQFSVVNTLSLSEKNKNDRIINLVNEILRNISLPAIIPPKIEMEPPMNNCLFDSRRDEQKQVDILNKYRDTGEKE